MSRFSIGFCVVFLLAATAAAAEDEEEKQARIQFDQGIRMYEEGDFEGASIAFNRAFELRPSYKILYNVGQVEAELKHYARALEAYREYLDQGGEEIDAKRKKEVSAKVEELKALVGQVTIEYSDDGVTVLIDEERRGTTPLEAPLLVSMGSHELSLRKGIDEIYRETFRVAGGQEITLSLEAQSRTTETAAADEAAAPGKKPVYAEPLPSTSAPKTKEAPKKKRVWTFVALGVGAAAGIAGGALGGAALSREGKLKDACPDHSCAPGEKGEADAIRHMTISADVLYGVASVSAITALVLFFVEPRQREKRGVSVAPVVQPSHAGLVLQGRF